MVVHTVLFLTNGVITSNCGTNYDYKDGIYNNINNNDTFVRWSGQKKNNITDNLVLEKENIHIWYRKTNNRYRYLGKVKKKIIFQRRDNQNILIVDLFIEKENLSLNIDILADTYNYKMENGHKFQKYKMDCFRKLNLIPNGNWCSGIMEGTPIL
tara:strand:- start:575 stop:1039 length:465 start_codon:yes stop_codon:yes gene_type:complete